MRQSLRLLAVLAFGLVGLTGCNSKSIQEVDKDKAVIYDSKRDGDLKTGGGPGGAGDTAPATMTGKKPLPKPK